MSLGDAASVSANRLRGIFTSPLEATAEPTVNKGAS
jgi:hypothetical protein